MIMDNELSFIVHDNSLCRNLLQYGVDAKMLYAMRNPFKFLKNKNENKKLVPHSLEMVPVDQDGDEFDFNALLTQMGLSLEIHGPSIKFVETLVIFVSSLSTCTSWSQVIGMSTMFIHGQLSGTLTQYVVDIVAGVFAIVPHAGDEDTPIAVVSAWREFHSTGMGNKLKKLMAILSALGICASLPEGTFKDIFNGIISGDGWYKIISTDIVGQLIEILSSIVKRFKKAIAMRDLRYLFKGDDAALAFDKDFATCLNCFTAYTSGALEAHDLSEFEYLHLVDKTIDNVNQIILRSKPVHVLHFRTRRLALLKVKANIAEHRRVLPARITPFSFLLFGKAGVGKSTMLNFLIHALHKANELPCGSQYVCTVNPEDKYLSEYKTHHCTMILDDIANKSPKFDVGGTAHVMINTIINCVSKFAVKAAVDEKGEILITPRMVIGTTNRKDLLAGTYSNEPFSVIRRFPIVISVEVKPEYLLEGTMNLDTTKLDGTLQDIWNFTVERPVERRHENGNETIDYQGIYHDYCGQKTLLTNVGIDCLISYLVVTSKKYFISQESLLNSTRDVSKIEMCEHERFAHLCADCQAPPSLEPLQSGFLPEVSTEEEVIPHSLFGWLYRTTVPTTYFPVQPVPLTLLQRLGIIREISRNIGSTTDVLLLFIFVIPGLSHIMDVLSNTIFRNEMFTKWIAAFVTCIIVTPLFALFGPIGAIFLYFMMFVAMKFVNDFFLRYRSFRTLGPNYRLIPNSTLYKTSLAVCSVCTLVCIAYNLFRKISPKIQPNGGDLPVQCPIPVDEPRENPWNLIKTERPLRSPELITTSMDNIETYIIRHHGHVTLSSTEHSKAGQCNIFPLCNHYWIIPYHMICKGKYNRVTVRHLDNHTFTQRFPPPVRIGNTDLAIITLTRGGPQADVRKWFPLTHSQGQFSCKMYYKNEEGVCVPSDEFVATSGEVVDVGGVSYKSAKYNYPNFVGLCMAPVIAIKTPFILGFHSAGTVDGSEGYCHQLTQSEINSTLESIKTPMIVPHSMSDMDLTEGTSIKISNTPHPKDPYNWFHTSNILHFGSHNGRRRHFRSKVVVSYISDEVYNVFGIPRRHGPPKNISSWIPWSLDAQATSRDVSFDPLAYSLAVEDFSNKILSGLSESYLKRNIKVLTRPYILSGINGKLGIDPIDISTSMGFPWNVPKSNYMWHTEVPIDHCLNPLEIDDSIWDECIEKENILKAGRRVNFVFRSHLKDEAIKLDKDKVRVFGGVPVTLLLLSRKYFLPIVAVIMSNRELFECAVGCNAYGPEWTKLANTICKFGKDRLIGGDYGHFDKDITPEEILYAFNILIEMARIAGYSEEELVVMRGIATEIAYAFYEHNGSFIMMLMGAPSGNALTVIINNIVNCHRLRYCYYVIFFCQLVPPFHEVVSVMCYGDDNLMGVHEDYPEYNHTRLVEVFATCGIIYTMAEKTAKSIPYIDLEEATFLKRHFVWEDAVMEYLGPLDINSIFKTLHCHMDSEFLTLKESSRSNVDNALREIWYHGEANFTSFKSKMDIVMERSGLEYIFNHTYSSLLDRFKEKYGSSLVPVSEGACSLNQKTQ